MLTTYDIWTLISYCALKPYRGEHPFRVLFHVTFKNWYFEYEVEIGQNSFLRSFNEFCAKFCDNLSRFQIKPRGESFFVWFYFMLKKVTAYFLRILNASSRHWLMSIRQYKIWQTVYSWTKIFRWPKNWKFRFSKKNYVKFFLYIIIMFFKFPKLSVQSKNLSQKIRNTALHLKLHYMLST